MADQNGVVRSVKISFPVTPGERDEMKAAAAKTGVPASVMWRDGGLAEARRRLAGASDRPAG